MTQVTQKHVHVYYELSEDEPDVSLSVSSLLESLLSVTESEYLPRFSSPLVDPSSSPELLLSVSESLSSLLELSFLFLLIQKGQYLHNRQESNSNLFFPVASP